MSQGKRVVIVGGGIVGLSCALYSQREGHSVTIIDPKPIGTACSYGNAGILAVSECLPMGTPELIKELPKMLLWPNKSFKLDWTYAPRMLPWFYYFLRACRANHFNQIIDALIPLLSTALDAHFQLAEMASCSHLIHPSGWLKAYSTRAEFEKSKAGFVRMQEKGIACSYFNSKKLIQFEPKLREVFKHAVLLEDCQRVDDPGAYLNCLKQEFIACGGQQIQAEVVGFDFLDNRVIAARTQTDSYQGDMFVVAAGAFSKKITRVLGYNIPLDTERGYHLEFKMNPRDLPSTPVFWAEEGVVMSPIGGRLRVTSGVEFAGLKKKPDFNPFKKKIKNIRKAFLGDMGKVTSEWLGFRPSLPDSLPIIGRSNKNINVFFAFGHGHLGLTLGPVTGKAIANLISGKNNSFDLNPYRPSRFN